MVIEQRKKITVKLLIFHLLMTFARINLDGCSRKIDGAFLRHGKNAFHAAFMQFGAYAYAIRLPGKLRAGNHIFTLLTAQDFRQIAVNGRAGRESQAVRHNRIKIESAHEFRTTPDLWNSRTAQHQCGAGLVFARRIRLLLVNGNPVVGIEMNHILLRRKAALQIRKKFP